MRGSDRHLTAAAAGVNGTLAVLFAIVIAAVAVAQTPAQANPSGLRSITVTTEPKARVWVDGVLYGTTDEKGLLRIQTGAAGRKIIRVRADGFKEVQKPLLAAQSGAVSIPLAKTTDEAELAFQNAERLSGVDRRKAIDAYKQAARLRPGYVDAQIGLARVAMEDGDFELALSAISATRKAKPGVAEVSAVEGRVLKSVDDEAKAIAAFKRAIREGNGFQPEAYAGLGLLYKEKAENHGAAGEYEQEAANYNEAARNLAMAIKQLSGAPDAVVLYQFLGLVYEQQKKPEKAIGVYEEFLSLFPGHPEAEAFRSFIVQLKKQP